MEGVLIAGAVFGLIWYLTRSKKPAPEVPTPITPGPVEEGEKVVDDPQPPPAERTPPDDSLLKKAKDAAEKIGITFDPPPVSELPIGDLSPLDPEPPAPGKTPSNPIPSTSLWPGFCGYFLVQTGDTMIKIAGRLGVGWRDVRDDPANDWAVEQCPTTMKVKYYGGEDGIGLTANYGRNVGTDCAAKGWSGTYYKYHTPLTGQFPVLGWKVDEA